MFIDIESSTDTLRYYVILKKIPCTGIPEIHIHIFSTGCLRKRLMAY